MANSNDDLSIVKQMVDDYISNHNDVIFSKTIRNSFEKVASVVVKRRRNIEQAKKVIEDNKITLTSMVKEGVCSKSRVFHKTNGSQSNYLSDFIREMGKEVNLICVNESIYKESINKENYELEQLRKLKNILMEQDAYIELIKKELKKKDPNNKLLAKASTSDNINTKTRRAIENAIANAVTDVEEVNNTISSEIVIR